MGPVQEPVHKRGREVHSRTHHWCPWLALPCLVHYPLPFRFPKLIEQYEASDCDVVKRLKQYKEGVEKYLHLKDTELKGWQLEQLHAKMQKHTFKVEDKTCHTEVDGAKMLCPTDYYYGPDDVLPETEPDNSINLEDYTLESIMEHLLYDKEIKTESSEEKRKEMIHKRHMTMRQYVLGTMRYTGKYYDELTRYFRPEPDNANHPSYPEITWDPESNDAYVKCMLDHIFRGVNSLIFPLRIYADNKFIGRQVSRYSYLSSDDMQKMTYKGCILVSLYQHSIYVKDVTHNCGNPKCQYYKLVHNSLTNKPQYLDPGITKVKLTHSSGSMLKQYTDDVSEFGKIEMDLNGTDTKGAEYLEEVLLTLNYIDNGDPEEDIELYYNCPSHQPLIIKRKAIKKEIKTYYYYVFSYNDVPDDNIYKKFALVSFRANTIEAGHIIERFKMVYIELNQLMYLIGKQLIVHREGNTNRYYYSPYLHDIMTYHGEYEKHPKIVKFMEQLTESSDREKYLSFLKSLTPYKITKSGEAKTLHIMPLIIKLPRHQKGSSLNNKSHNKSKMSKSKTKTSTKKSSKKNTHTQLLKDITYRKSVFVPRSLITYSLQLTNTHNKETYKWNIKKSTKEEMFYNYPIDILVEKREQYRRLLNSIANKYHIKINPNSQYPTKVLEKLYQIKKNVRVYSNISERINNEYIDKHANKSLKSGTNIENINTILYHRFIYHYMTFHYYYINQCFDLLPETFDSEFRILNLSHHLGYAEACIYKYIKKESKQLIDEMIHTQHLTYMFGNKYEPTDAKKMRHIYNYGNIETISSIWTPEQLNDKIGELSGRDLAFVDTYLSIPKYNVIRGNLNHMLFLGQLILALGTLNQNGKMLISIAGIGTKFVQDLLYIINQHFVSVEFFETAISEPEPGSCFLIAKGFQINEHTNFLNDMEQMKKIYADMYKNDPSGGLNYVPNQPKIEKLLDIPKRPQNSAYKYYNSLLSNNESSIIYHQINSITTSQLTHYSEYLDNIDFYMNHILKNKDKHDRIQLLHQYKSAQMAKFLDLRINPYLNIGKMRGSIMNNIYRNMYGLDTTVYYRFRLYSQKFKIGNNKLQESNEYLLQQVLRMENATKVFDTRKIENYNQLKKNLRYYEKTLNKLIKDEFNSGIPIKKGKIETHPSRAWIKMYEVAEVTKLIPKKAKNFKALCFCEAPGNFVLAINHFIKTKTEIENFDWVAQSYNPNANKDTRDFHVIGDDYDLMRKYPDKWDFGPKNTGDVTDPDNIKYYGSVYDDVDLLTSDCGTDWGGDDLISSKLMFGQLMFILNNLPEGKNFVIKYYIPFIHYPAQMALFYVIYQSFKEISFYKPLQNAWSHEFYLVGKKYKKLDYDQLKPFFDIMENYNPYMSPINLDKIPDEFMKQIEKATKDVVDRFVFYIERYIYYLDLIEDGKKPDFDVVAKHIEIINKEWLKEFKIKKISNKDKI